MAPQKVLFLLFFFLYSLSYILLLNAILRLSAGLAVLSHVWEISLARQNLCPNCLSAKKRKLQVRKDLFSLTASHRSH